MTHACCMLICFVLAFCSRYRRCDGHSHVDGPHGRANYFPQQQGSLRRRYVYERSTFPWKELGRVCGLGDGGRDSVYVCVLYWCGVCFLCICLFLLWIFRVCSRFVRHRTVQPRDGQNPQDPTDIVYEKCVLVMAIPFVLQHEARVLITDFDVCPRPHV